MSKLTKELSVNPPNNWKRKGNKSTNKQSHYQPEILEEPTPNKFTYSVQDVLSLRKATTFSYDQDISEFQEVISKESLLPVLQDGRAMKEHQDVKNSSFQIFFSILFIFYKGIGGSWKVCKLL